MFDHETPVEAIQRASAAASFAFNVVMATAAVVTHFAYVITAGRIRLACDKPAVAKLRHSSRIGHLYPFYRVDINPEVPRVDLARLNTREQAKVACYH